MFFMHFLKEFTKNSYFHFYTLFTIILPENQCKLNVSRFGAYYLSLYSFSILCRNSLRTKERLILLKIPLSP